MERRKHAHSHRRSGNAGLGIRGRSYYPWPYPPLDCFAAFKSCTQGVEALIHGYQQFEFAKHQPPNYRSPFWRGFRVFQTALNERNGDILWSNLFRCSIDSGSPVRKGTPEERQAILALQSSLLTEEIRVLSPTAVLFFTGPDYDFAIEAEFPGVRFVPIPGRRLAEVAQLSHSSLPALTYRTYHPAFLQRDRDRWRWLDALVGEVVPGAAT